MKVNNDGYVLYLVVREKLDMSPGKLGAQCGHAVQYIMLNHFQQTVAKRDRTIDNLDQRAINVNKWLSGNSAKVVLKADEKEWKKLQEELPKSDFVKVVDAGHTELEPGTETVIAVFPVKKSEAPKIIKRLQLL